MKNKAISRLMSVTWRHSRVRPRLCLYIDLFMRSSFFYILLFSAYSCTADELPAPSGEINCEEVEVSYDLNIKAIIDRSCAYSGCHLDVAPGKYSTYNGLSGALKSGKFEQRVLNLRFDPIIGMPPDNAPEGRPRALSEEELDLVRCWLNKGFPEN